jgi:hypothetical protein
MRKPKQQGTAKIDVALHHQLNARNYAQYAAELRKKAADLREYLRLAARDACGPLA